MANNGKARNIAVFERGGKAQDYPARVQSYAHVVGVSNSWTIIAASDNCSDFLGHSATELLGKSLSDVLDEEVVHLLRSQCQVLSSDAPVLHIQGMKLSAQGRSADVTVTRSGTDVFFEFETAEQSPGLATGLEQIQRLVNRISRKTDLEEIALEGARTMQILTGVDRVSVHRVGHTDIGPALGMSGRPPLDQAPSKACLQAHARAFRAHLHYLPDLEPVESSLLLAAQDTPGASRPDVRVLSSYSPSADFHGILRHAGVQSVMTIPIRMRGELWGVFLCHSNTAVHQPVGRRSALALFSTLFGYEVQRLFERVGGHARSQALRVRDTVIHGLDTGSNFVASLMQAQPEIQDTLAHDGVAVWSHGTFHGHGKTLTQKEFEPLFAHLQSPDLGAVTVVEHLSDVGVTSERLNASTTTVMAIPISMTARDFLLLFRHDAPQDEHARNWEDWEIDAGNALRSAVLESQLRLAEDYAVAGVHSSEQTGVLLSELNHRVRNTLNLIRGMISQGRAAVATVEDYAEELESRVFALARAHDQLTKLEWGWVSMKEMLNEELSRFLGGNNAQVDIRGDDLELSPTAYTTLALVVHELTTNAQKYGAFSTAAGKVLVDVAMADDGFAELSWRETGGPRVTEPQETGFGMTIVEQSVPFELRGNSDVTFAPEGLSVKFRLPPGHIRPHNKNGTAVSGAASATGEEIWGDMSIDGAAMIVEDSLIIAIDAADLLRSAGATKVYSCNSVESAFKVLDEGDVSFALLDVNLGEETSLAIAEQLWTDGIPAVLATGYGRDQDMLKQFPPMPVLTKPYDVSDLKDVLRSLRHAAAE